MISLSIFRIWLSGKSFQICIQSIFSCARKGLKLCGISFIPDCKKIIISSESTYIWYNHLVSEFNIIIYNRSTRMLCFQSYNWSNHNIHIRLKVFDLIQINNQNLNLLFSTLSFIHPLNFAYKLCPLATSCYAN